MNKVWFDKSWDDYLYWQAQDKKILKRINDLIQEAERTPFTGKGKPEALKGELSGFWSRRITGEHRLIYRINGSTLEILSCKGHYEV